MNKPNHWNIVRKHYQAVILFLLALLILTPGFYKNTWNATGKKFFLEWRKYSDYMVIGRLAESQQHGVLSGGAMIGIVDGAWPLQPGIIENQLNLYLNRQTGQTFWAYKSVPGAQGIIFGLIDHITRFPENFNLKLFSGLSALLTAIVLAFFLIWLQIEAGVFAALVTLLFMAASEWLTLYGGAMYWQLWAFYLPVIALTFYILKKRPATPLQINAHLFFIISTTVLVKCLFNGFEFITTTLVMIFTPIVYYAVLNKWPMRRTLPFMFQTSIAALAGVAAGLAVLLVQITASLGSIQKSIDYLVFTFIKRTQGDPNQYLESAGQSSAGIFTVIRKYIEGRALNLGYMLKQAGLQATEAQDITYLQLFSLFALFSLLFLLLYIWKKQSIPGNIAALFITTLFSLAAPLSWFVIFKAHSYIHTNLNFIVWQMPFTLLGFAFCGALIQHIFRLIIKNTPIQH